MQSTMHAITLDGHLDHVTALSWSGDSEWLASGSMDRTMRVWCAASGRCKKVLCGPEKNYLEHLFNGGLEDAYYVSCIAWSPGMEWIASGSFFRHVCLWLNDQWEQHHIILKGHSSTVTCLAWIDATKVLSGSDDCSMRLWDARAGNLIRLLHVPSGSAFVSLGRCNHVMLSVHFDNTVRVWSNIEDLTKWEAFRTETEGEVRRAALSPDCKQVAAVCKQADVVNIRQGRWGVVTARCVNARGQQSGQQLVSFPNTAECMAWSADGKQIAMGTSDGWVLICDAATGKVRRRLNAHVANHAWGVGGFGSAVTSVALSPDGMRVAAAAGNFVRVSILCEWSDKRNKFFDPETRRIVFCMMCIRERLQSMPACLPVMPVLPVLPTEMWLEVFAMLPV